MHLVIIGNGFDLHHKLPTSFNSFREYLAENNNNELVVKIDKILKTHFDVTQIDFSQEEFCEVDWSDYECALNTTDKTIDRSLDSYGNISAVRTDQLIDFQVTHDEFSLEFFKYLKKIVTEFSQKGSGIRNEKIQEAIRTADVIISFNYTSLYNLYDIPEKTEIFHMHGTLEDDKLPIIGFSSQYNPSIVSSITNLRSEDYMIRYNAKVIDKQALAFIRNQIEDIGSQWENFSKRYSKKISRITSIGFSYGPSDNHFKNLLDEMLKKTTTEVNVNEASLNKIDMINVKIFDYFKSDTDGVESYFRDLMSRTGRRESVHLFGIGYDLRQTADLIKFERVPYQ